MERRSLHSLRAFRALGGGGPYGLAPPRGMPPDTSSLAAPDSFWTNLDPAV